MKLLRPHIPLETRCRVLLRQLGELWPEQCIATAKEARSLGYFVAGLKKQLSELLVCGPDELQLDHEPALENREKVFDRSGQHVGYRPDANDPNHLIYRTKADHQIKTNVRGDGAQYSDRALAKRERRRQRGNKPSRPIESANRWPPKGSRKINWRSLI